MRLLLFLNTALAFATLSGCSDSNHDPGQPLSSPAPVPIPVHPVFHTQVTGLSARRPAVQVDVLNEQGNRWFSNAKLYLTVQSSRFPENVWVVLPVNVGDFSGCKARFVQLPFEIESGETLAFNLLDDVQLTRGEEERILAGCRLTGFCICVAGRIYAPQMAPLIAPAIDNAAELLGQSYLESLNLQRFTNLGTAEFIAPVQLPEQPHTANRLTLLDSSRYAHMQLRLYGPRDSLGLELATTEPSEL